MCIKIITYETKKCEKQKSLISLLTKTVNASYQFLYVYKENG